MGGSPAEHAIDAALRHGNAIVKFITPNEVGATGGHQYGYLLPKPIWKMFTDMPPTKGGNTKETVRVRWHGAGDTESSITWYGDKTRSEYRLTRFGKGFPFLEEDLVGDVLVLVRTSLREFEAFVVAGDEETDQLLAALDIEIGRSWGAYTGGAAALTSAERIKGCLGRRFESFASRFNDFPDTTDFSREAVDSLRQCDPAALKADADDCLMSLVRTEYELFRHVERKLCSSMIEKGFGTVDAFLKTASSIMNRRKSRAGRSLENHVSWVLNQCSIPHAVRPQIAGRPDIVIPDAKSYENHREPGRPLWILGVKSTCKDRWRQVLQEAPGVKTRHLLTVQPSISSSQIADMRKHEVTLVVPREIRKSYARSDQAQVLTLEDFVSAVRQELPAKN